MVRGDFADGDAMAAALDEHRDAERKAVEAEAAQRVTFKLGELREIILALERDLELAELKPVLKSGEFRVRTAAINIAARNRPLIAKLKAKESAAVAKRAGRRGAQSNAGTASD
ncbi:MAG: hypothetical protein B7Y80_01720 [Hyphomicrobium sp. 32-62-53]|nr:MAG: hypothetical protein B7Z29_02070 [Hyphomicrobium sp. 12-62-95]OYY01472.1 MAG: hypothetical protein B7Y80_01720 [Hyphomicrobium sp. 32-62-53]